MFLKQPYLMKIFLAVVLLSLETSAQNVVTNPTATQTIVQPPGTSLNVNTFEYTRYADQFN